MRTSGLLTVLASLLLCPTLRAESRGPDAGKAGSSPTPPKVVAVPAPSTIHKARASGPNHKASESGTAARTKRSDSAEAASGCVLSGTAVPALDLQLTNAEGQPLARFGGVPVALSLSQFPGKPDGKVHVATTGEGRLRLDGFVPIRSMPLYLTQDVPLIARHIKALKGTSVEYLGLSGNQIRVTIKTKAALNETFNTTVSCDALTLEAPAKAEHWSPPGHARGYLMKQPVLPLFDKPGADAKPVTSIHLSPDARGILFFGDRREGDYIHVLYHQDVAIDGWIPAKELEILPRGEVMDQSVSKYVAPSDKKLQLRTEGHPQRAPTNLSLYGKADPKQLPIGHVMKDTELYVLDVVVGWANVLPKQLDVVPVGDRHFWVRASELGM